MKKKSKFILVTGVSTGIGYGTAAELIARGYQVLGSVRRDKDAAALRNTFGENFIPLIFDVTKPEEIAKAVRQAEEHIGNSGLAGLINNSGIAIGGPLADIPMEKIRYQFEVNVIGLLNVTRAFLPLLGAKANHPVLPGRIINISSVAGKIGVPFLGAYSASKFAVEGISDSLRRELQLYGIDVIMVGPGNVITPIWYKADEPETYSHSRFFAAYSKFLTEAVKESKKGYTIEEIGKEIADIFEKEKPKVRYALVKERMKDWTLPRLLPARVLDKVMGKAMGLVQ